MSVGGAVSPATPPPGGEVSPATGGETKTSDVSETSPVSSLEIVATFSSGWVSAAAPASTVAWYVTAPLASTLVAVHVRVRVPASRPWNVNWLSLVAEPLTYVRPAGRTSLMTPLWLVPLAE